MTAPTIAVVSTAAEARRRVAAIRNALALADDLLAQAYAGRDWTALGHASWEAYCATELPELRMIKLRAAPRRERVAALLAAGASQRDIMAATGASLGTVNGDVAALTRPAPAAAPVIVETRAEQVVRLIAAAGTTGRTSAELEREMKAHHGIVSGALSRVARQGRVTHTGTARGGYGVYAVTP